MQQGGCGISEKVTLEQSWSEARAGPSNSGYKGPEVAASWLQPVGYEASVLMQRAERTRRALQATGSLRVDCPWPCLWAPKVDKGWGTALLLGRRDRSLATLGLCK